MKKTNLLFLLAVSGILSAQTLIEDVPDGGGTYTKVNGDLVVVPGNGGDGDVSVAGAVVTKEIDSGGNPLVVKTEGGTEFVEKEKSGREKLFLFKTSAVSDAYVTVGSATTLSNRFAPAIYGVNQATGNTAHYSAFQIFGIVGQANDTVNDLYPAIRFRAAQSNSTDPINSWNSNPTTYLVNKDVVGFYNHHNMLMKISADGNMGINEDEPEEKLHVDGNAKISGAVIIPKSGDISMGTFTNGTLQP